MAHVTAIMKIKKEKLLMTFSEIELPSNKRFGFFFTFIFSLAAAYFYNAATFLWACVFFALALLFLVISVKKADIFFPLNKLWMRFGLLLGMMSLILN